MKQYKTIENILNKIMEYAATSHNMSVYSAPAVAGLVI